MRSNLKGIDSNFGLVSNFRDLSCLGSIAEESHNTNWLSNKMAGEIQYQKMQSSAHGKNNLNYTYTMIDSKLAITTQERDLEVFEGSFLKTSSACSEGNGILGKIRKENE